VTGEFSLLHVQVFIVCNYCFSLVFRSLIRLSGDLCQVMNARIYMSDYLVFTHIHWLHTYTHRQTDRPTDRHESV